MDVLHVDCDSCVARGLACNDCVVTVLLGESGGVVDLDADEQSALKALAESGLARIHRFVWCGGVILSVSRCYRLRHGVAAGLAASVFHIRVVVPVETGPVVRWSLRLVGR